MTTTTEFTDWLKIGRSIATERTIAGNVNVIPMSREPVSLRCQRSALEGINPFHQGTNELRWQFYKAGHLTIDEVTP